MHIHGPNLLPGPVSRHRGWWDCSEDDIIEAMSSLPPCREPSTRKKAKERRPAADAPIRTELVQRVRKEIADGTYDTPQKWEAALDRLLDRLED
jgi:hypothetical protein